MTAAIGRIAPRMAQDQNVSTELTNHWKFMPK